MWKIKMFLNLIFTLFVLMIARMIWLIMEEKKKKRMTIFGDIREINKYIEAIRKYNKGGGNIKKNWTSKGFRW